MTQQNISLKKYKKNELMSKKHKKVCITLNYIEHFLILAFIITGFVSVSVFACLVVIPVGTTRTTIGLKTCVIIKK